MSIPERCREFTPHDNPDSIPIFLPDSPYQGSFNRQVIVAYMREMQDYYFYNARRLRALYTSPSHFFSSSTAAEGADAAGPSQLINTSRSSSAPLSPSNPKEPSNTSAGSSRLSSAPPESKLYNGDGDGGVRAIEAWQARVRNQEGASREEDRAQRDEEEFAFRQKERERMKPVLEAYYRHKRRWHPEEGGAYYHIR